MKLKTLTLATGFALAAMSLTGSAQAGALATAVLDITNFKLSNGSGVRLANSNFAALVLQDTADMSASLNGVTNTNNAVNPGLGINLTGAGGNYALVGAPLPAYVAESFAVYTSSGGTSPVSNFAIGDQIIEGSPINAGPLAHAGHSAYVSLLDGNNDGSATANNGLNSSFIFKAASAGSIMIDFNARAYLETFTSNIEKFPAGSSAQYSLQFTIENLNTGAVIVDWKPNGTSDAGGASAFGLLAETDTFSLNSSISRGSPFPFTGVSYRGSALGVANSSGYSAKTVALNSNDLYQFTIRSTVLADATTVPEPTTLALLGLGLLGLGVSRRRT